jgi:hypothetical protein
MAMLNSRQSLREQNSTAHTALGSDGGKSFGAPVALHNLSRGGIEVTVQQQDFREDVKSFYPHMKNSSEPRVFRHAI